MRRQTLLLLTIVALGCGSACTEPPVVEGPTPEEMIASADALDRSFVQAFNQGDAVALAGHYWDGPDVVSFLPDSLVARGVAAIEEGNARGFVAFPGATLELTESHQVPAGDMVVGWGLFRMTMPGPEGNTSEMLGRYTDVKAERDGRWVYIHDHTSVPLPPAAE